MTDIWSLEKAEDYQRLSAEHAEATMHAAKVLRQKGMDSPEFREADAATGRLYVQIRELLGKRGQHWMA